MRIGMTRTIIGLFILAGAVFILNKLAITHFLYWRFWWYDIMMHFLGGTLIGGLSVWGASYFRPSLSRRQLLYVGLIGIAAVGIGWEFFEFFTGQYVGQANIAMDTMQDLIMDTLGTIVAWLTLTRIIHHEQLL